MVASGSVDRRERKPVWLYQACATLFLTLLLSSGDTAAQPVEPSESQGTENRELLVQLLAQARGFREQGFKRRALPLLDRAANLDVPKALYLPVQLELAGLLFDLGAYTEAEALLAEFKEEYRKEK